ncbi:MAG: dITP/XTP pyrophosphatase [bacterium P3]|nr:MAG: dITP/XTP pyrophosphatase [bacterium P3]KWW41034.1 MAG: dITP/XTP pyrophosphatase [bacterium F083]
MNEPTPIERLSDILDILRHECPWDRAQTFESLRYLTIEEVYELSDAILSLQQVADGTDDAVDAAADVKKELGDLLMHVLFYAKIADDNGYFSFDEVCHAVCDKLVSRHPHIALPLRDGTLRPPIADRHPGWERLKMREGRHSVLDGVPRALPSLVQAVRLQEKAEGVGYTDPADDGRRQLLERLPDDGTEAGDLLFAWVWRLRRQGVNADEALALANRRFMQRVALWEGQSADGEGSF